MNERLGAPGSGGRLPFIAQLGLLMGPFLSMVDSNIVNVALSPMAQALHASLHDAQWIVSAYLLALSAVLACSAFLAKRFGTVRVYVISMAGFTIGSVLCALSPSLEFLIAARVFQGAFGALLVPLAMTLLIPREKDGAAQISPILGIILFMAPAIGPSIGGLLIQVSGWPLIFLINIPFAIFGLIVVALIPRQSREQRGAPVRFDLFGILALSLGVVGVTYGATNGPTDGWFSSGSLPYWVCGALLIAVYALFGQNREHPAVNLKLLADPFTSAAIGIATLTSVVNFGMVVIVPIFMQSLQRQSALTTGLALIPQALMSGVGTALSNRITKKLGILPTVVAGMLLVTGGTVLLLLIGLATTPWVMSLALMGRAFAIGLVVQPLLLMSVGRVAEHDAPDANTLFMIASRIGGAAGIALLVTFFQVRSQALAKTQGLAGAVAGFHETVLILTAVSLLGLLLSVLFLRQPAAKIAETATDTVGGLDM